MPFAVNLFDLPLDMGVKIYIEHKFYCRGVLNTPQKASMPNTHPSSNGQLYDSAAQARKLAALLLDPWMTPEVEAYMKDSSHENFEKAKDILTLPAFRTTLNQVTELTQGHVSLDPWLGFLPPAANSPDEQEAAADTGGKKHRGAPLGNHNAYKHGFYARRLPGSHVAGLEYTGTRSLEDEISVLRIFIRRVIDLGGETEDLGQAMSILRIISLATLGINRLVRTQLTIADPYNEPMDKLAKALEEMENDPEFQEKQRIGSTGKEWWRTPAEA